MFGTRFWAVVTGSRSGCFEAYGSTIEEARADLFGLYYLPDDKMIELGLTPDGDAFKAELLYLYDEWSDDPVSPH